MKRVGYFSLLSISVGMLFVTAAWAIVPPADFAHAVGYSAGGFSPVSVAVADLNGDGKLDIVIANQCVDNTCATGTVGVLLGNGDGTFQAVVTYASGGNKPAALTVADVNKDGKPDVLVVNACVSSTNCSDGLLGMLLGNGDGSLQGVVTYSTGGSAYGVGTGDANHDGKLDAIVGTVNGVASLIGNGDGTFKSPIHSVAGGYGYLVVADFNGDGIPDAAVDLQPGSSRNPRVNGQIGVLFGNGDGTFNGPFGIDSGGFFPQGLALADMDRDGHVDILVANKLGHVNETAGSVVIFYSNGRGGFTTNFPLSIGGTTAAVLAGGDLNGDGVPDVAVSEGNLTTVITNGQVRHHDALGGPTVIAIADLNGDGQADLVAAVECFNCGSEASVLLSKPAPTKTTVTSSLNPSKAGQAVTFTATVTCSQRGPIADGTVISFFDGAKKIGTGVSSGSVATFTTTSLSAGTHTIKAKFSGYVYFKTSSGTVKQVVNP